MPISRGVKPSRPARWDRRLGIAVTNSRLPIRVAVIGAGANSQKNHLSTLRRLADDGRCRLAGVCDLNREAARRAAESFGFGMYTHEARELLEQRELEAVYIIGSAQMQHEYAKAALQLGRHVFVEKPPAPSWPEALELQTLAERKGLVAVVGFNRRFQSAIHQAKMDLDSIQIHSAEAYFHKPSHDAPVPYGASSWLTGNTIHAIDTLNYVLGDLPTELFSSVNAVSCTTPENLSALLKWRSGAHAVLASNNTAGARFERYLFHGTAVSYECDEDALYRRTPVQTQRLAFEATPESGGWWGEHVEFLDAIAGAVRTPRHTIRHGVAALYLAQCMEQGFTGSIDWTAVFGAIPTTIAPHPDTATLTGEAVLVLNPKTLHAALPTVHGRYRVVYEEQLGSLNPHETKSVVAAIAGRDGSAPTDSVLDRLPSLRVVGIVGGSVKRYNAASILRRGIPIINTSDVYAVAVAEFVVMLAILGLRGASRSHETIRARGWGLSKRRSGERLAARLFEIGLPLARRPVLRSFSPQVKRILRRRMGGSGNRGRGGATNFTGVSFGIVGLGAITRSLVHLLKPFECRIRICSEYLTPDEAARLGVEKTDLAGAFGCRVVSLQRGRSSRTIRSIGARELDMLKAGAVFINTARGELVDTEALVQRLKRGDIFACLDVFEREPLPPRHPLRRLPNVFLTSHISGSTDEMYEDAAVAVVEKTLSFLAGEYAGPLIADEDRLAAMT
jgi:phosphoglycerate dehydrogenase-like enzyme/predicted dehydrogenase